MRLSVIIPGYANRHEWWERCVKSVLAATSNTDEILCVDDGSPSQAELRTYVSQSTTLNDPRVKWLWLKENVGLASARNAAIEIASGDYLAFVDSDDEVKNSVFSQCIDKLVSTDTDICIYGVRVVWVDDGLWKSDMPEDRVYGCLDSQSAFRLYDACLLNYACNKVYRRSFLGDFRFDRAGMPCEDIIFNLGCVKRGARFCSVPVEGYVYYRRGGTLVSRYNKTYDHGMMQERRLWIDLYDRAPLSELDLLKWRWKNIWMAGTPYSLFGRARWLRRHPELGGLNYFLKTLICHLIRRYAYVRPLRRVHLRRSFPSAIDMGK